MVDKNLFLYDLGVVSIMKNAAPYVEEWLNYHLLAGADHFFIYDNESEDNFKEILQPYIDAGLVTYIFYPGNRPLMAAYNDAIDNFKFECRYMTFVDDDEFILPRENVSITEVADDFLVDNPDCASLEFPWVFYGSSGQDKADYSRGVLERFKRRASQESKSVKSILNPRRVDYMWSPHFAIFQKGYEHINQSALDKLNVPFKIADKIVMNHYHTKSWEEYCLKRKRGDVVAKTGDKYADGMFKGHDKNDVFDEEILRYRKARYDALFPKGGGTIETFAELKRIDYEKILIALTANLFVPFKGENPKEFFSNKKNRYVYFNEMSKFLQSSPDEIFKDELEKFLTCLSLSKYLKENFLDAETGELFEEYSLLSLEKVLRNEISMADLQLLMQELPRLLALPYAGVYKIRKLCIEIIDRHKKRIQDFIDKAEKLKLWKEILQWDYRLKMLKVFDNYNHK